MQPTTHRYSFTVKEHHLDTLGHVNNATVLALLEEARWEWITGQGYGMDKIHALKQGPVILEVTVKYRKELRLRREYTIESTTVDYKSKIGWVKQYIKSSTGEIAVEATFTIGLFDLNERKLIEPSDLWLRAIGLKTEQQTT